MARIQKKDKPVIHRILYNNKKLWYIDKYNEPKKLMEYFEKKNIKRLGTYKHNHPDYERIKSKLQKKNGG